MNTQTLPNGTVTFLFTDIEGSTKLAREHPDKWELLRQRHHTILRSAMDAHHGYVFQIIGDAFCVAFKTAGEALQAAGQAQQDSQEVMCREVTIQVRIKIHPEKAKVNEFEPRWGHRNILTICFIQYALVEGVFVLIATSGPPLPVSLR